MSLIPVSPPRQSILPPEREVRRHDAKVIAQGAGVNFLGTLAKTIKSTSFVLMTRLFGTEVFGLYIMGWSVIDLLSKVGTFGLDKGVVKFVVQYHNDQNEDAVHRTLGQAVLIGLTMSAMVTGLVYLAAPFIADRIFHKLELTRILQVFAFSIPFLTLSQVLLAATKSLKIMRFDVYVKSIVEPLVLVAAACLCFLVGWRLSGIALAHLAAAIGGAACALYFFRRLFSSRACVRGIRDMSLWSEMTKFSLPVVCYDLLYILMMRLDALMLGYFLPAVQVGIYGAAIEMAFLMKKVRQWFEPIFAPIISELHYHQKMQRLADNFSLVTRWILTVNLAFFFSMILIGRDILAVFGSEFTVGALSLTLLSLSQVIYGSIGSGDMVLLMSGHPYLNLLNTALVLILNVGLGVVLIPQYGMTGAAVGTLVSFGMLSVVRLVEVYVLLRIHPFRRALLKPFGASLIAFVMTVTVAAWFPTKGVWRGMPLTLMFLIIYGTMLVRFGLEQEDCMIIGQIRNRFRTSRKPDDATLRLSV